jgi:uncharacterized protein
VTAPRLLLAWLAALCALLATPAWAQSFPKFTGLVVDAANVLPADRKAALEQKLQAFQQASAQKGQGRQLVVATIPDLGGEAIEDYGYKLGRAWGVGLKGADSGALLIVAPNEHRVRIEAGRGTEGILTDAYSSVIINTKITPAFKAKDMPGGIEAGTDAIIDILSQPDDEARAKVDAAVAAFDKEHKQHQGGGMPIALLFPLIIFGVILTANMMRRSRYGRQYGGSDWPILLWAMSDLLDGNRHSGGWGGGGGWSDGGGGSSSGGSDGSWGGGGFTGGGGGDFGGGGASGSW